MSLRSINTGASEQDNSWSKSPFVDARSQCVLVGYDRLPINKNRILIIGTTKDDRVNNIAREVNFSNNGLKIEIVSDPKILSSVYFGLTKSRVPEIPLFVLLGSTMKTYRGSQAVLFRNGQIPAGYSNPFEVVYGLGKKYGTEIIRFHAKRQRPSEIARMLTY